MNVASEQNACSAGFQTGCIADSQSPELRRVGKSALQFSAAVFGLTITLAFGQVSPAEVATNQPPRRLPTLSLIGDSTVRNGSGQGGGGLWGWGGVIAERFDPAKLRVENRALGGRSSRTYFTEGLWDKVLADLKPGDFVMMQFGHNDGGELAKGDRPRASLKGNGDESLEVTIEKTGKKEIVHTYGWYLRKYVVDTKAKGATPIVVSPIPRNVWKDGKVARASNDYGKWAAEAAQAGGAFFVDLNQIIANHYDELGEQKVAGFFTPPDHTHTTLAGAKFNAAAVAEGIRALKNSPLLFYLSTAAKETSSVETDSDMAWPIATREQRPWTRWWWLGSAVDKTNLTRLLKEYRAAGLGGVEICPIYGAKGYEDRFIDFLSPKWMELLAHTGNEAKRLDLGMDLTTGTGWPFGGPNVTRDIGSAKVVWKRYELPGGEQFKGELPQGQSQCVIAASDKGERLDLTDKVRERRLDWTAPPGKWRVYALAQSRPVQRVKRAAPGGEGNVLDPYSVKALNQYLARFDGAFADYHGEKPRSFFHDSFEYYGAQWTPDFFREFNERRGYDLRTQLPALFGDGPVDTVARVKGDYRETISDLHLAYIQRWTEWCHARGSTSRNQAHGAPGNLLDLYAAADIPETEIFGSVEEKNIPMNKFASSAAHVAGHNLASAESFTWLGEHFQVSLSQVKQAADYLFLTGVNHIFFHGIPYSPADAPWPGWQFYAAVNFGPQGGLWRDLPEFNAYVARCQSILQGGAPDNDVLLYFPLHDIFQTPSELLIPLTVHNIETALMPHPFYAAALRLWNRGYACDEVSDRFLAEARCVDGKIILNGNSYRVAIVPAARLMPEATFRKLAELARTGATILFEDKLPSDVPGLGNLESRRAAFRDLVSQLRFAPMKNGAEVSKADLGKGAILAGGLEAMLQMANVAREPMVDSGLRFVRRTHATGRHYFIANRSKRLFDGWITLGAELKSAVILDPRFEQRSGIGSLRRNTDGDRQVYLQLQPDESCMLRTFTNKVANGSRWEYVEHASPPKKIGGVWKMQFIEGGPELPASFETRELASWTEHAGAGAERFAGTARHTIEFDHPGGEADDWLLDLGRVCESARVKLNGRQLGALWCAPFQENVGAALRTGTNILEVEVTNLAANRIADLDRRKVNWKYFYDINVASRSYRSLDASDWPLFDSGLLGPVTLTPLKKFSPAQ